MAWRSSGTTNDEMVDNLKRFGVIQSPRVERAFRNVDRVHFCPQNLQHMAYSDQPLRQDHIHLSAPHMYGCILEQLDIPDESSISFLNVGSGSGYMSCIVAEMLSKSSVCYGIELQQEVLDHCMASIARWQENHTTIDSLPHFDFIRGNGLHIDATKGESVMGYDRIYVGASIDARAVVQLAAMLRLGGVLVAPVDEELIKVVRIRHTSSNPPNLRKTIEQSEDFTSEVISAVRFASLARRPRTVSIVPSRVWDPAIHQSYPESFQKACTTILMCSNAPQIQPLPRELINSASTLPKLLWMEILSYTHRSWFEQTDVSVESLQKRLAFEQANVTKANEATRRAEQRVRMLERECANSRRLARLWQSRFLAISNGPGQDWKASAVADDGSSSSTEDSYEEFAVFMHDDEQQSDDDEPHTEEDEQETDDDVSVQAMELTISNESVILPP